MLRYTSILCALATTSFAQTTLLSSIISRQGDATSTTSPNGASTLEPCALVASAQAGSSNRLIPGALAYDCYQSVPVNTLGDIQLIDDIKLFLGWNTDTQYLKNLPDWYDNESFDFLGGLDKIKNRIQDGSYRSEYEVQSAITALLTQAGDNHVGWSSDISQVFSFQTGLPLVSVSSENNTPEVYSWQDLAFLYYQVHQFEPSPITHINDEETQTYLRKVGKQVASHDAHARYNKLFPNQAQTALGKGDVKGVAAFGIYRSPNTTYTFKNGTRRTFESVASIGADFSSVDSGKAFLSRLLSKGDSSPSLPTTPNTTQVPPTSSTPLPALTTPTVAPGYPAAILLHASYAIGGYYLNGSANRDVAVLSIPTFDPEYQNPTYPQEALHDFQRVAREFISKASADGKKKIVIDLRANGGGSTFLGFDLFKLFFPEMEPYHATRRRAHQPYEQLVKLAAQAADSLLADGVDILDPTFGSSLSEFYYRFWSTAPDGTDFASPAEYYGPHTSSNDNFTSLRAWNLSTTSGFAPNSSVAGYGGPLATPKAPFNASNIVLLQDGACSSTCAIFSELMRTLAGVQTLAIGGLPQDTIAMQKVGGTKGWLTWDLKKLRGFSEDAYGNANESTQLSWRGTELEAMNKSTVIFERTAGFQVNAADGIRRGDSSETPLQFVYEAAECRIWYSPVMVFDVSKVWEAAANTKWGNGTCNAGPGWAKHGDGNTNIGGSSPNGVAGRVGPSAFAVTLSIVPLLLFL